MTLLLILLLHAATNNIQRKTDPWVVLYWNCHTLSLYALPTSTLTARSCMQRG